MTINKKRGGGNYGSSGCKNPKTTHGTKLIANQLAKQYITTTLKIW